MEWTVFNAIYHTMYVHEMEGLFCTLFTVLLMIYILYLYHAMNAMSLVRMRQKSQKEAVAKKHLGRGSNPQPLDDQDVG